MPRCILAFFTHSLTDPFFKLWLREVVVIDPAFVSCIVWGIYVNAFDSSGVGREKRLKRKQIVALDNQVAIKSRVLAFWKLRQVLIKFQYVVRNRVMVGFDRSLTL